MPSSTSPVTGRRPELVCPVGNRAMLEAAIEQGADAVYLGFKNATNARNFNGLNFDEDGIARAIDTAHARGCRVFLALNTYPQAEGWTHWTSAVDRAASLGVDTLILADLGLLAHARERHPELRLHLSVQGSATNYEALAFYHERYGIERAVLPRVLSLEQVAQVVRHSPVAIEVFGFGGLCVMVEGRCALSAYATGQSPNCHGACSPAKFVRWDETPQGLEARLNGFLIDRYAPEEPAGYPTLCKGRFAVGEHTYYAIEEPTSLNTLELLPRLIEIGVAAIKIEGRQRSAAYVAQVTRVWREAIDAALAAPQDFSPHPQWLAALDRVSEGASHTLGAYSRPWK